LSPNFVTEEAAAARVAITAADNTTHPINCAWTSAMMFSIDN